MISPFVKKECIASENPVAGFLFARAMPLRRAEWSESVEDLHDHCIGSLHYK